jgi:hypothetical protein
MTSVRQGAVVMTLALLAACGGSGSSESTGRLTIGLTDGPVEGASAVIVAFTGVELKAAGDGEPMEPVVFDADSCEDFNVVTGTCSIDLLELQGTASRVVFNHELPAGRYNWVRLLVDADMNEMDSYIDFGDDRQCSLYIPSGDETGLKIVSGITVTANGLSEYTLDFDVRKSVTAPPGQAGMPATLEEACSQNYFLKPAIRIVDTTEVGTIAGTVLADTLSDAGCSQDGSTGEYQNVAVYVFDNAGGDAVADDIDGDGDPVTTATVVYDEVLNDGSYAYEAGFLLPQDYLVALTCTTDKDLPDSADFDPSNPGGSEFGFIAEGFVTVETDGTSGIDFAPEPAQP